MRASNGCVMVAMFVLSPLLFLSGMALAGDARGPAPDKALCAEMIRFGVQSYQRSRYLDAKEYFRKAIQADPSSAAAWRHYDLAVIYALAEKVNKDNRLIAPDTSPQDQAAPPATGTSAAPPPAPAPAQEQQAPAPSQKPKFKIADDEGC